jgi:hypothetical protein
MGEGGFIRMKPEKPRPVWCGTIKILPYCKALSAEHRPKFCSPSPVMVTSRYIKAKKKKKNECLLSLAEKIYIYLFIYLFYFIYLFI